MNLNGHTYNAHRYTSYHTIPYRTSLSNQIDMQSKGIAALNPHKCVLYRPSLTAFLLFIANAVKVWHGMLSIISYEKSQTLTHHTSGHGRKPIIAGLYFNRRLRTAWQAYVCIYVHVHVHFSCAIALKINLWEQLNLIPCCTVYRGQIRISSHWAALQYKRNRSKAPK